MSDPTAQPAPEPTPHEVSEYRRLIAEARALHSALDDAQVPHEQTDTDIERSIIVARRLIGRLLVRVAGLGKLDPIAIKTWALVARLKAISAGEVADV